MFAYTTTSTTSSGKSAATTEPQILVLGLGNDLLADDAIGILAARELRERLSTRADVIETSLSGLALLEMMTGYSRAVIIDAICTGRDAPGTISQLDPAALAPVAAPSPHYAGLPEMFDLAEQLDLEFPQEIVILAVEVEDPLTIDGPMTPAVEQALPELVQKVEEQVARWAEEPA